MTLKEAIARNGYDPSDVLAEIAETNAMLDELGLVLDSDPRSPEDRKGSNMKGQT